MLFLYNNLACLASLWLLTVPFSCTSSPAISDSLSNFNLYSSYILFFWEYFFPIFNIFFFLPLSPYFFLCFSPLLCMSFLFFLFSIFFPPALSPSFCLSFSNSAFSLSPWFLFSYLHRNVGRNIFCL